MAILFLTTLDLLVRHSYEIVLMPLFDILQRLELPAVTLALLLTSVLLGLVPSERRAATYGMQQSSRTERMTVSDVSEFSSLNIF